MTIPRFLLAVPLIVAGIFLPAAQAPLDALPAGVIGMGHQGYEVSGVTDSSIVDGVPVIVIRVGQTLTFQNDSRWIHVIGPGKNGLLVPAGMGAMTPLKMLQENDTYTTPPWNTPGTYLITCTVHPDMNAKVVVLA